MSRAGPLGRGALGLATLMAATPAFAHGQGLGLVFFGAPLLLLGWAGLLVRALGFLPRGQRWRLAGWTLLGAPLAFAALGIGWALLSELLAPWIEAAAFETLWVLAGPLALAWLGWQIQNRLSRPAGAAGGSAASPVPGPDLSPLPDALPDSLSDPCVAPAPSPLARSDALSDAVSPTVSDANPNSTANSSP